MMFGTYGSVVSAVSFLLFYVIILNKMVIAADATSNNNDDVVACGIWVAPSTIQGAGLGMYAGVDFYTGQEFLVGGDSVVAISDIKAHNANKPDQEKFLWDDYTWGADGLQMDYEGYDIVEVASEGFGSAANSFLALQNVEEGTCVLDGTNLHRSTDPGVGASTMFHHRKSFATKNVNAGYELFVSYGDNWFIGRTFLGPVPLVDDLNRATELLLQYTNLQHVLIEKNVNNVDEITADVWTTFVKETKFINSRVLLGSFRHYDPDDLHTLQHVHNNDVTAGRIAGSYRSLDWLRAYGTCGDHIVGQPSTLPQAGLGAFATRKLPRGTIVSQLPMIHVPNRTRLDMYQLHFDKTQAAWVPVDDKVIGQQLLLNYCYGHAESTLLLCPYGPLINYVNHNQTRANVQLVWGNASKGNHMPELFEQTIEQIQRSDLPAKLAMELIATREIQEGEEILLDYGDDWEMAWNHHVEHWKPVPNADQYKSAIQLQRDTTSRIRTIFEELEEPTYTTNVELRCNTLCRTEPYEVERNYKAGTLDTYLDTRQTFVSPCHVLRYWIDETTHGDEEYLYAIHLFEYDEFKQPTNNALIHDVPRALIHFVDKPGTSDMFLPNAFRHDIRIPDEIFPMAWRNLKTTTR